MSGIPHVQSSGESEQRFRELVEERDTLKQQVAELENSVKQVNRAFDSAQKRIQELQKARSPVRESRATPAEPVAEPVPVTPEPETTATESTDNRLQLGNVRIEATERENVFRIAFSVMREGDGDGRVTGTIWIAVNGFSDKKPRRLSFKTLSPERRSYVKMGFDLQQDVLEEVVLPADFRPKNLQIEAKPYGEVYSGTAGKFTWDTAG